jgi:hypothetical protein
LLKQRRVDSATADIRAIGKSLGSIMATLVAALERANKASADPKPARLKPAVAGTKRLRLSAERRAELKLQGRYMGLLRSLRPHQKARVRARRAAKGLPAAISLAITLRKT